MRTRVSTKGQLVLPAELRREDDIHVGDEFVIERIDAGQYRLTRVKRARNEGLVDLLLECPEKDWFAPIPSESTEDL